MIIFKNLKSPIESLVQQWQEIDRIPFSKRINPILRKALERSINKKEDLLLIKEKLVLLNVSYERCFYDKHVSEEFLNVLSFCKEQDFCFFLQSRKLLKCSDIFLYYQTSEKNSMKQYNILNKNSFVLDFNKEFLQKVRIFHETGFIIRVVRKTIWKLKLFEEIPDYLQTVIVYSITKKNCLFFLLNTFVFVLVYQVLSLGLAIGGYYFYKDKLKLIVTYIDFCQANLGISLRSVFFIYNAYSKKNISF